MGEETGGEMRQICKNATEKLDDEKICAEQTKI